MQNEASHVLLASPYTKQDAMWTLDAWRKHTNWETLVQKRENGKMARLVREVFGNPFKMVAIEVGRLTPAVEDVARTIYETYAFKRLPEVADLLEANGYNGKMLIEHCRDSRPHFRGCWASI